MLERLLNLCATGGVRLSRLRRDGARAVSGRVAAADYERLETLAEERGWRLIRGRASVLSRISSLPRARAVLVCGSILFFALLFAALSCVWSVEIVGAGSYEGEVRQILMERDIRAGRLRWTLGLPELSHEMERRLTGLSWVGVRLRGVRLMIECVPAELAGEPRLGGVAADLLAARDGIVQSIKVVAGTPMVQTGDAVRAGQTLIAGYERAFGEAVNPVRARGEVLSRVWYRADARVSGWERLSHPTGQVAERIVFETPLGALALSDAPDYAEYDLQTQILPIGGGLPVWLRRERYVQLSSEHVPRDAELVRAEAGLAALRLAFEKAGGGVQILDKWVEYSMIDGGGYCATAVVEALEPISVYADEYP